MCREEMAERGEWPGGNWFWVFYLSPSKNWALCLPSKTPPLWCFSVAWPLCLLSLFPVPLLWFSSPPCFQKLFPLLSKTLLPLICSCVKGERGTPSQGSLRCSHACAAPHSWGSRAAACTWGEWCLHYFGVFFFFSFYFFIFVGIQKWVTTVDILEQARLTNNKTVDTSIKVNTKYFSSDD